MKTLRVIGAACLCMLLVLPLAAQSGEEETEPAMSSEEQRNGQSGSASGSTEGGETPRPVNEEELAINDSDTSESPIQGNFTAFSWWDFLRMFVVLGAVIAVIYGVFFVLKRVGNPGLQANNLINVLSTQNLQGNRSLHLVEVGNEVFLIGSSEGNVGLVSKIEDGETIDELRLYRSEMGGSGKSFQETLRGLFNRESQASESPKTQVQSGASFLQKQRERLKKM